MPAESVTQIFDTLLYEDQAVLLRDQATDSLWTPKLCEPSTILIPY